jgi:hypothetical protein
MSTLRNFRAASLNKFQQPITDDVIVDVSPGGVAQWTSHPPQEQEDPGLNPARV